MACAIILVAMICVRCAKKYGYTIYDMMIVAGFSLLFALPAGSILYTIVTYDFSEIIGYLSKGELSVFGGLVYYGALIGGIVGALIGIKVAGLDIKTAEKIIIPYIPVGHSIGRVGCILAGCCYGREYSGPFALHYPNTAAGALPETGYFPVQILEAILNIGICFVLVKIRKRINRTYALLAVYLVLYGSVRFFLEFLRGDSIRGIYFEISTSQWISIVLSMIGAIYLMYPIIVKRVQKRKAKS